MADHRKIAVGLTIEHWSDKDTDANGFKTSRYWKQVGSKRMLFPLPTYQQIIKQPWAWEVKLFAKNAQGDVQTTALNVLHYLTIRELDELIAVHRAELLTEFPDTVADGWRATIKGAAGISKKNN